MSLVPPVIIKATTRQTGTLIFLHGLGDTGVGWAGALNTIRSAGMKVICPTAPIIPVTLNQGFKMPAWYDIFTLDTENPGEREDLNGVVAAAADLEGLVQGEVNQGISRKNIFIGGFSQGGAVALYATLRSKEPLAGCIALSTYVPGNKPPVEEGQPKSATPILQCHGEADEVVPFKRGKQTLEILKKYVAEVEFKSYANMGHEANMEELDLVKKFMSEKSPQEAAL